MFPPMPGPPAPRAHSLGTWGSPPPINSVPPFSSNDAQQPMTFNQNGLNGPRPLTQPQGNWGPPLPTTNSIPPFPPAAEQMQQMTFKQMNGPRAPTPQGTWGPPPIGSIPPVPPADQLQRMTFNQSVLNRPVDLFQQRQILPPTPLKPPELALPRHAVQNPDTHCDPDIFRCTLGAMPSTQELAKKARLPLGLILHPFKDMKSLTILQVSVIVRCRSCRTYINPYVQFTDNRHWKCNICFRTNDLPDDFSWDPVTKSFGEPQRRPEIRHATIEFIAPGEYMLRPPQPAVYLFILDVSANAVETGYLGRFCSELARCLDRIPGDDRTQMGFITVDSGVHFYEFTEDSPRPRQLIVTDLEDMFVPSHSGLLVNISENKEIIRDFVQALPTVFEHNSDPHSALGAAVSAAHQILAEIGGRVTVVQTVLPDVGPGSLQSREDPNQRASDEIENLNPATDFYKRLALDCSGHQIAVDLFLLSSQFADLATLAGMAKFCGGSVFFYPSLHLLRNSIEVARFEKHLQRYFCRKIGFESVLRIRCTKGLSLHTFHGNFFVRSTDLLALPNVNPDSGLGVQLQMDENLTEASTVCFQSALLYTSSRGDRRIRVHTLCLPVSGSLTEIHSKADVEAIASLLAKLAAERSVNGSLTDAREALVNAVVDGLGAYAQSLPSSQSPGPQSLLAPAGCLRLLPLFVLGLLKNAAFALGTSIKLDRRYYAMSLFKSAPLKLIVLEIYPTLFPLHTIEDYDYDEEEGPPRLQLSYEKVDRHGLYLMDTGSYLYLYVGQAISDTLVAQVFGVRSFSEIDEDMGDLPELDTVISRRLRQLVTRLQGDRPLWPPLRIIREDSPLRELFTRRLVDDRTESSHSYIEFLQHIRRELSRN